MLKIIFGLALILVSQSSFAERVKFISTKPREFYPFIQSLNEMQQFPLAKIRLSPSAPKQGEKVTAFVELSTTYSGIGSVKPVLAGALNGKPVRLMNRGSNLWILEPVLVQKIGQHQIEVKIWLEDQAASDDIRNALTILNQEIFKTQGELAREVNPDRIAYLQNLLTQKNHQKTDLENTLSSLKRSIGSTAANFTVSEAESSNDIYPILSAVDPQVASLEGGALITLTGRNLQNVNSLKIGNVTIPSSQLTISSNSVQFISPSLVKGAHSIEVFKELGGEIVTAQLNNAYFATDASASSGASYPVAFAGLPVTGQIGQEIALDGSQSYDSSGASLTYQWDIVSRPTSAASEDGSFSNPNTVNPIFSALTEGSWVVSLVVNNGVKASVPSLTTINIGSQDVISITPSSVDFNGPANTPIAGVFKVCSNRPEKVHFRAISTAEFHFQMSSIIELEPYGCYVSQWYATVGNQVKSGAASVLVYGSPSRVKLLPYTLSPQNQTEWYSDSMGLDKIGDNVLLSTYDEDFVKSIFVKNNTNSTIEILETPFVSNSSITTNFPSAGVVIHPGDFWELKIYVPSAIIEDLGGGALFVWNTSSSGLPKSIRLTGSRLRAPTKYEVTIDMPSTTVGDVEVWGDLGFCQSFFSYSCPDGLSLSEFSFSTSGETTVQEFSFERSWVTLPYRFLPYDGGPNSLWVKPSFQPLSVGSKSATLELKITGYLQTFKINMTGTGI